MVLILKFIFMLLVLFQGINPTQSPGFNRQCPWATIGHTRLDFLSNPPHLLSTINLEDLVSSKRPTPFTHQYKPMSQTV